MAPIVFGWLALCLISFGPLSHAVHHITAVPFFHYTALESVLGFITVLPGAFSAYRYTALVGDGHMPPGYHAPLDKYFASLPDPNNPNRTKSQGQCAMRVVLRERGRRCGLLC